MPQALRLSQSEPGRLQPVRRPVRRMDQVMAWLEEPTRRLRRMLRAVPGFEPLRHVSVGVHDPGSDLLWTMAVLEGEAVFQAIDMADAMSLTLLADETEPRVVGDLAEFGEASRFHSAEARAAGCRSCMTVPLRVEDEFIGFVMYGAAKPNFFGAEAREVLDSYSEAFAILFCRAVDATSIRP